MSSSAPVASPGESPSDSGLQKHSCQPRGAEGPASTGLRQNIINPEGLLYSFSLPYSDHSVVVTCAALPVASEECV